MAGNENRNYVHGFLAKCAEYRVPCQVSGVMLKQAVSDNYYRHIYDELAKEYGYDANDEGYAKFLNGSRMPKRRNSDWWYRRFHSGDYIKQDLRNQFEQLRRQPGMEAQDRFVGRLSPEYQEAYSKVLENQRQQAALAEMEKQDPETYKAIMAERERMKAESAPKPPPPSKKYGAGMLQALRSGEINAPRIHGHYMDEKTGRIYRTDGGELDNDARHWNMRLAYNGPEEAKPKAAPAAPAAASAPVAPPKPVTPAAPAAPAQPQAQSADPASPTPPAAPAAPAQPAAPSAPTPLNGPKSNYQSFTDKVNAEDLAERKRQANAVGTVATSHGIPFLSR